MRHRASKRFSVKFHWHGMIHAVNKMHKLSFLIFFIVFFFTFIFLFIYFSVFSVLGPFFYVYTIYSIDLNRRRDCCVLCLAVSLPSFFFLARFLYQSPESEWMQCDAYRVFSHKWGGQKRRESRISWYFDHLTAEEKNTDGKLFSFILQLRHKRNVPKISLFWSNVRSISSTASFWRHFKTIKRKKKSKFLIF